MRKDSHLKSSQEKTGEQDKFQKKQFGKQPAVFSNAKTKAQDAEHIKCLGDEGKCFTCESKEHLSRDCPKQQNLKPPKPPAHVGAVSIESGGGAKLNVVKEGTGLGIFFVSIGSYDVELPLIVSETPEMHKVKNEILHAQTLNLLNLAVPFAFDQLVRPAVNLYVKI